MNSSNLYISTCQNNSESYDFKYFNSGSSLNEFDSDEINVFNEKIKIDKTIGGTRDEYIVLFKAELQSGKKFNGGVEDRNLRTINSVSVYPNPTNSILNVSSLDIKISNVEIWDIQNKLVYDELTNSNYLIINVDSLSKGLYLLKIEFENLKNEFYKIEKY